VRPQPPLRHAEERDVGACRPAVRLPPSPAPFSRPGTRRARVRGTRSCAAGRWRSALRSRRTGGGCKPPRGASVKSRGAERRGNSAPVSAPGVSREGERKRTVDDVSKASRRHQNRGRSCAPGWAWEIPAYCPGGVRHKGGASSAQAPMRNVRTCRSAARTGSCGTGDRQAAIPARRRVPMRITGTDRLVVAMTPGNAGRAKGADCPGSVACQPFVGRSG
jgi:hypothetical protein